MADSSDADTTICIILLLQGRNAALSASPSATPPMRLASSIVLTMSCVQAWQRSRLLNQQCQAFCHLNMRLQAAQLEEASGPGHAVPIPAKGGPCG